MKQISAIFSALLISLLVLLVAGQGLASGLVLCVGADGHSAYEQASAGKCTPIQLSCPVEEECACAAACTDEHCGPCQDIAVSLDSLHGRWRGEHDLPMPLSVPFVAALPSSPAFTLFVRDLTTNLSPPPPPPPYTALTALRSVVLLN